jgi:hypothetical protein
MRRRSDRVRQQQNDQDYCNQPQPAAGEITPVSAVTPGGQCAQQCQNQNDDQNCRKHVGSPDNKIEIKTSTVALFVPHPSLSSDEAKNFYTMHRQLTSERLSLDPFKGGPTADYCQSV